MALCSTCNNFDLRRIFPASSVGLSSNTESCQKYIWNEQMNRFCFMHSDNMSQIQAGASAGCGLCGLLFDAFVCKEPEAAQDAGRLPIILAACPMIEDDRSDAQLPKYTTSEPRLRAFFVSPEEGLISL